MEHPIDLAITATGNKGLVVEPSWSGVQSFYRRRYTKDLGGVDLAVTGVPYDCAVTNRPGARLGPEAVRRASSLMSWDAPWPWKRDPFGELSVVDYGDCWLDPGRPAAIAPSIESHVDGILAAGAASIVIGGDHFVTYPVLRAYAKRFGPLALVHFDAHSDTWEEPEKRIDHGTMFYHAAREGIVDAGASVQLGLRTHNKSAHGYNVLDAFAIHEMGAAAAARKVLEITKGRPVYLSFDIDYLDPSCAPGTGTPVCAGFSTYEARRLVMGLAGIDLVGADLVEVSPPFDLSQVTALAGATLAADFVCLWNEGNRGRTHRR